MRRRLALTCVLGGLLALAACGPRATNSPDGGPGGPDAPGDVDGSVGPDADLCSGGTLCGVPVACCPAGNECVLDRCVPACATGVYCGANAETCCGAGQVCLANACVAPTTACADPYDCQPGEFCEPTLGQCLPQPDPLTCQLTPVFADLEVTLERKYESTAVGVASQILDREIISIPVVANLDGAGAPEIVVNLSNQDGGSFPVGRIAILDGATLSELVPPIPHQPSMGTYGSHGRATIAVGDVSGDALPDVIYAGRPDQANTTSLIVAIDRTGALLWTSHAASGAPYAFRVENGAITLANFDADPMAEIVIGATLLDHDGTVIWDAAAPAQPGFGSTFGTNAGYQGGLSAVADLDGDGAPEIVSGRNAWKVAWNAGTPTLTTVTAYWTYAGNDGFPAVADLDRDGAPEVVLVASSQVIALDGQTGALFCAQAACPTAADRAQPIAIPGGTTSNRGGPPTIADFDGDGRPELGVAGGFAYSVYDLYRAGEDVTGVTPTPAPGQLFVRWTKTTKDTSSNVTGSSVFDFQGDGSSEVIYQDECYVHVYSGTDGRTQLRLPNTTGTIHEYPLVVDADGDGNSEILVVANATNAAGDCPDPLGGEAYPITNRRSGLYVFGDTNDRWVPTRKVWTQHTYHVTNATTAGNVPLAELDNWAQPGLNDYRKNAQGEGVFNAPDLAVDLAIGLDGCATGQLALRARVTNLGALGVYPGVEVTFRAGGPAGAVLGTGTVATPLLPGQAAIVTLDVPVTAGTDFYAGVDGAPGAGAVAECDEQNNQDTATGAMCPVIL